MEHWEKQHVRAMQETSVVSSARNPHETAVVALVKAWVSYANAHRRTFEQPISEDYYTGPLWESIGRDISRLLNCETGRLDCGSVDKLIRETLTAHGFTADF